MQQHPTPHPSRPHKRPKQAKQASGHTPPKQATQAPKAGKAGIRPHPTQAGHTNAQSRQSRHQATLNPKPHHRRESRKHAKIKPKPPARTLKSRWMQSAHLKHHTPHTPPKQATQAPKAGKAGIRPHPTQAGHTSAQSWQSRHQATPHPAGRHQGEKCNSQKIKRKKAPHQSALSRICRSRKHSISDHPTQIGHSMRIAAPQNSRYRKPIRSP